MSLWSRFLTIPILAIAQAIVTGAIAHELWLMCHLSQNQQRNRLLMVELMVVVITQQHPTVALLQPPQP